MFKVSNKDTRNTLLFLWLIFSKQMPAGKNSCMMIFMNKYQCGFSKRVNTKYCALKRFLKMAPKAMRWQSGDQI